MKLVPGFLGAVVRGFAFVCAITASAYAQDLAGAGARQLVVPFENATHEPRYYWLSEGSAVVLTDDLTALGAQALARDDRIRAFDQLRVPVVATLSDATIIRIGQVVGAAQVVIGSFEITNGQITVRARPIRLDTGRMSPEISESGALTDLFAIYAKVARRLLPDSTVTTEQMESGHPPLAAFEQYVKGVIAENPATQISLLKEALRIAPTFQRVRLALWSVYTEQSAHQQALAVVRQVPARDPLAREARFRGALSLMSLGRNADAADALISLNGEKSDPALLNDIGVTQLRRAGRNAEPPTDYFKLAVAADPADPDLAFNLGYALWLAHDSLNAAMWLREAVRLNPGDGAAHWVLGVALQASANAAEGQREKDLARRLSSMFAEFEKKQPGANAMPANLERVKSDLDAINSPRVQSAIAATEQRDQREQAAFHVETGRKLFQQDRDADAINELRRAIYLAPYDREAHLLLGRLYLRGGRVQEAIDELKISIWSDDQIDARLALAGAYIQAKDAESARLELQNVLAREPNNADARRMIDSLHNP
jgi:tetratricopeptide (TPR) repeat protein/TolB-like protein